MPRSYSLNYYERLFGSRGPEFWELMSTLLHELSGYASDAEAVGLTEEAFARLRHAHRPTVQNLGLRDVQSAEHAFWTLLEGVAGEASSRALQKAAGKLAAALRLAVKELEAERGQTAR